VASTCEHCNEIERSITAGKLLCQLSDCCLHMKDTAPCVWLKSLDTEKWGQPSAKDRDTLVTVLRRNRWTDRHGVRLCTCMRRI
jgi:hypothetical protein